MKRIFINTDSERLSSNIFGSNDPNIGIDKLSIENEVLYYDLKTGLFVCNPIETNIILIKDECDFDFSNFNISENDYILHHSKPFDIGLKYFGSRRKKGAHLPRNPIYSNVFKIIFNDAIPLTKKAQHIIDFLFPEKHDIVLDFLIECYNCHDSTISDLILPEDLKKFQTIYNSWKEAKSKENLITLRDALLDWAENETEKPSETQPQ